LWAFALGDNGRTEAVAQIVGEFVELGITTVPDVIDDVVRCAAAGASVLHYHARDAQQADIWKEVAFYRDVMDGLAARGCDAITYPPTSGSSTTSGRCTTRSPPATACRWPPSTSSRTSG